MVRYPVVLEPDDNGTLMVTFPDFPEAQTFGEDRDDAMRHASDALATIVDGYIRSRRPLPKASEGTNFAELSPLMSAKAELYSAMQAMGVTKSELGRRLHWHQPQVDRLLNLTHSSQVDQLEAAVRALGGHLVLSVAGIPMTAPRRIIGAIPRRMAFAAAVTTSARRKPRRAATNARPAGQATARGPAAKKK
jgi:antitoxin HicB